MWFATGHRADLGGNPLTAASITKRIPGLARHDVYVCGPPGMTAAVTRELLAAGVKRRHVHVESFEF